VNTLTPAEVAGRLRTVADRLDLAEPAPVTAYVVLAVSRSYPETMTEAERVAAVDAVASALGMSASPTKLVSTLWQHLAERSDDGFHLSVSTHIAGLQICTCGAACTDDEPRAAAP
jgi:hypothetical protein